MSNTKLEHVLNPVPTPIKNKGFLVYIPCHTDFEMAVLQASTLRNQFLSLGRKEKRFIEELIVIISVNGVTLSKEQMLSIRSVCDELIYSEIEIGADLNISQGFARAIQKPSEFFWILSTNDKIGPNALSEVVNIFLDNPNCDLIGADENAVSRHIQISNILINPIDGIHFGLISAVIYRTKNLISNFPTALKLNWTGWGQLGVIQTSCFTNGTLSVVSIPRHVLFSKMASDRSESEDDLKRNGLYYSHSFFGMPILIAVLFAHDKKTKRKFLRSWLFSNWFKVRVFSTEPHDLISDTLINEPFWRQSIAEDLIRVNGFGSRFTYFIGKTINWYFFRHLRSAKVLKNSFSSTLRQRQGKPNNLL
jgi:hypothetical protein